MFKRDATPRLKSSAELVALSEAELRGISDAELGELIEHLRGSKVVRQKQLYLRCADRRCRRMRKCTADNRRCRCADVPPMGKRERKRGSRSRP